MKKTILLLSAALLPCIPATLHSGEPQPVIPVGYGYYAGRTYVITDKAGKTHYGVVTGNERCSITIPFGKDPIVMRCNGLIIPLD